MGIPARTRTRRALITLLGFTVFLSVALPASAATPASLQGETFSASGPFNGLVHHGSSIFSQIGCDPLATTSIPFSVSGTADGPYPGTFTEHGTVTVGPQVGPGFDQRAPVVQTGPITHWVSTFTIASGTTTITGSASGVLSGEGECGDFSGVTVSGFPDAFYAVIQFGGSYSFGAVIDGPSGSFANTGHALVSESDNNWYTPDQQFGSQSTGYGSFLFSDGDVTPIGPGAPTSLTLSPVAATNAVGTQHTVTATSTDAGGLVTPGITIRFSVSGSTTTSGWCVTGADGTCAFSYTGPDLPGADAIVAYADTNLNGSRDTGEPQGEASKAWILPVATAGQVTGGGQIPNASGSAKIAFGFTAKSDDKGIKGECSVVDIAPATNIKIKCTDVTNLVVSGTHATLFGNATVNGIATTYRIDVNDYAEPGVGHDTFKIVTASGYSASGVLTGGNIQLH
jgi:hypothetical protein